MSGRPWLGCVGFGENSVTLWAPLINRIILIQSGQSVARTAAPVLVGTTILCIAWEDRVIIGTLHYPLLKCVVIHLLIHPFNGHQCPPVTNYVMPVN